jgi:Tfp pilus assembly protein PilF
MTSIKRIERIKALLIAEPKDTFLQYALAIEYIAENDDERAKEILENLLESNPEYVATYYHLGKLYERLGINETALAVYERGIEISTEQKNFKNAAEIRNAMDELLDN